MIGMNAIGIKVRIDRSWTVRLCVIS